MIVLGRVDVSWTPAKVALIPITILSGTLIFGSIWVITSSISFWTVETQEVANSFTYGGLTLSQYPIDVFGTWLRRFVTFVLPLAFVSYFPAAYLLDKPVPFGLPSWVALLSPVVAALLVLLARAVWQLAIRHYRSTGKLMGVVELDNVGKRFTVGIRKGWVRRERREVRAVDGVSLSIEPGAMVGYIGPNGAGKSTTIKMLTGILVPSSGSVRVAGLDPNRDRVSVARRIGVLFGQRTQLWWDLPLEDSFSLLRHVYRVPEDRFDANLAVFRELLALDELLPIPVRQLSLGQRMRGELAAVLLHDPAILFLDEPTIGLDPVSKEAVRSFLVELNCDARHHRAADHTRPRRRRTPLRTTRDHRSRQGHRRQHCRRDQATLRNGTHPGGRPRGARSTALDRRCARRPRRWAAAMAAVPP